VDGDDDVTVRHGDLRKDAILMTSSLPRAWAQQMREDGKLTQESQLNHAQNDGQPGVTHGRQSLHRRCSCGCDSITSPTGNSLSHVSKPEVEISPLRDGLVTSHSDGGGMRSSKTGGRIKPDIEMTRNQVLQVYVLDDRLTGSDVNSHVTRAPVNRRAPTEFSRRNISNFAAKSHQTIASDLRKPCQQSFNRNVISDAVHSQIYQHGPVRRDVQQNQSQTRPASFSDHYQSTLTDARCHNSSTSQHASIHRGDIYRPVVCTASLDRKTVESSAKHFNKFSSSQKPSVLSSSERKYRLRPAAGLGSLDREHCGGFRSMWSKNRIQDGGHSCIPSVASNDDEKQTRNKRFTEKNDEVTFNIDDQSGTTWSITRGRTHARGNQILQVHPRSKFDDDNMTGGFKTVFDGRRTTWTVGAGGDCDVHEKNCQRKSTSLERDDLINCRSRGNNDCTQSRWTSKRDKRPTKDPSANPVDWANSRWIKRQIHLPITGQRRFISLVDVQRRTSDNDSRHEGDAERRFVSSQTDPDNVCFSHAGSPSVCTLSANTARTALLYRTVADPSVRVQFTTDDNGNLVKV